jgi:Na+/proline symporter
LQVVILIAVVAALAFVVVRVSTGWADWIVLGVIVLTVLGGARAVFYRRYPTRKRTFIRHSGPGPDQR